MNNPWWETQYIMSDGGPVATRKTEISESGGTVTWAEERMEFDADFRTTLRAVKAHASPLREIKEQYTLDARGLAVTVTRAPGSSDESVVKNVFNDLGLLVKTTTTFRNDGDMSDTTVTSRIKYDVFERGEFFYDNTTDSGSNYKRNYFDLASQVSKVEHYGVDGGDGGSDPDLLLRHKSHFDELDRQWKTERLLVAIDGTESGSDVTTFEHDKAHRVTLIKDDNDKLINREYDLASRLLKTIRHSLDGETSGENYEQFEYDANGNVTTRTSHEVNSETLDSEDFVWEMAYDELNRVTTTTLKGSDGATGPNPVTTIKMAGGASGYDSRNLVIRTVDVDGVPTEHIYDGRGLQLTTKYNVGGSNPTGFEVHQQFDLAGNITAQLDAESGTRNTTYYDFDDQNRMTQTVHYDGDFIKVKYNQLGNPYSKKYGNAFAIKTIKYDYNAIGQHSKSRISWTVTPTWTGYDDYKTTEETFTFDGAYRLTNANDDDTKVTFTWNSLDQITEEKLDINLRSGGTNNWKGDKTVTSTWDHTGKRRTSVTYPISGKVFGYIHDELDRITDIELNGSPNKPMARYWYEGSGLEVVKRDRGVDLNAGSPNTFRTTFTEDALHRTTEILHQRVTGSTSTIRDLDYTWGDGSTGRLFQRSSYDISGGSAVERDLTYDKLGRLTVDKWIHPNPDEEYKYAHDVTQFYQKREKTVNMTTTTEREFTKASDGSLQMTQFTNPTTSCTYDDSGNMVTSGSANYYYDHNNRLAYIDGSTDCWYRFDVFGRMVVEKVGSTETLFYYDGLHIIEETDNSLALTRLSLFGIGIDEVLYSGTVVSGSLSGHRWSVADHLGSVLVVVDDSGSSQATFDYTTAYGEASTSGSYPYGFTGRRKLGSANTLYDYRTRTYDPGCGRFLQRDSIGVWGDGANLGNGYSYVGNDVTNRTDPHGLCGLNGEEHDGIPPGFEPRGLGSFDVRPSHFEMPTYLGKSCFTEVGLSPDFGNDPLRWARSLIEELPKDPIKAIKEHFTRGQCTCRVGNFCREPGSFPCHWHRNPVEEFTVPVPNCNMCGDDHCLAHAPRVQCCRVVMIAEGGGLNPVAGPEALIGPGLAAGGRWMASRMFKCGIHGPHHTFGRFGKLPHVQVNWWQPGVRGSGGAFRIPLPRLPRR